ncbi:hypothetical protein [Maricaulis sp.]|uniref:hypothetical protein n=1 Tax=Maricaulis sp. TaxID=1486257 RepID=UPI002B271EF8|nr:hypothetical protein [Maricaulis sp.]
MLLTPLSDALRRRLTAGALALAANFLIIIGLLFAPRPEPERPEPQSPEVTVVDLVFVSLPDPIAEPQIEPEPEPVPQAEPEIAPETIPETEPDTVAETPAEIVTAPEAVAEASAPTTAAPAIEAPNILSDVNPFNDDRQAIPFPDSGSNTEFALRSVFCQSTSTANRVAVACPLSDGNDDLPMLQFTSEENRERASAAMINLTADQIRALFDDNPYPGRDLRGQPTMADASARPTSSADQMRDTLPPLVPDPAFRD